MFSASQKYLALFIGILFAREALAADAPPAYAKAVMTAVSAKVEYPKMAKMRHQEGVVTVQITVDGTGKPTAATVAQSSGMQSLDDAALAAVNAAAPFPAPPGPDTVVQGNIRFTAE
jgi:protein TonB